MESKAIPLIVFEKGQFAVTEESIQFLKTITGKIAVIAVVGKYRTGKSFLLNRIILDNRGKAGFGVGPTINPCTKGLWIWSQGVETTLDGEKVTVLVIDSEGLGAFDEDANHDTRIFLLALLLSSYFIYNSVGSIDENALQNLSLIVNLSKQIQSKSGSSSLEDISEYFPSFLWVLRDFALKLVDNSGSVISTKEYLENSLTPSKGVSDSVEAKNRIRRLLTGFFKDRDCFALIRPTESEKALQRLDEAEDSVFRPEFLQMAGKLRRHIFRKVKVKMLNGACLTGEMLAQLAITYVSTINAGGVPNIEGAWSSVCNAECAKSVDECLVGIEKEIRMIQLPIDENELKSTFKGLMQQAVSLFKEKAIGENFEDHLKTLVSKVKEKKKGLETKNLRNFEEKAIKRLQEWTIEVKDKLREGELTNFYEFKTLKDEFCKELEKSLPGKAGERVMKELMDIQLEITEQLARQTETTLQNSLRKLQAQLELQQEQFIRKKEEFESEKDVLKSQNEAIEKEFSHFKGSNAVLQAKNDELVRQKKKIEESLESKLSNLKLKSSEKMAELKNRLEKTVEKMRENENHFSKTIADLQRENSLIKQELEFKNAEIKELKERSENFQRSNSRIRQISVDSFDKKDDSIEWTAEKTLLKSQIDSLKSHIEDNKAIQEALMLALNSKSSENPQHIDKAYETTRHLSFALEKSEENCKKLEQKLAKSKKFQKMVKNASGLQCRKCSKCHSIVNFPQHFTFCEGTSKEPSTLMVSILKAYIKESDSKPFTEYIVSVSYNGRLVTVPRKYKMFCYLHLSLQQAFPHFDLPELLMVQEKVRTMEERRKIFENYLIQLAQVAFVRENIVFRRFLGLEAEVEMESPLKSKRVKSHIELITSRAFSPSMNVLTPVTNTFDNKFGGK